MSTDRELLELATKAYLGRTLGCCEEIMVFGEGLDPNVQRRWNPRDNDGDNRRLAVKLDLDIYVKGKRMPNGEWMAIVSNGDGISAREPHGNDKAAAVRLAVLRVAAEIGRAMP